VIGEAIEVRSNRGIAPAGPPQAIDAEARHFQKSDLSHLGGTRNIMNAQTRSEFLAVGNTIGQRILEIAANVVIRLHGHDIRPVGEQEQVVGNLEVMRAGEVATGEEAGGLELARVRGIQDGDAVLEHVADIKMTAVEHDLHTVGPAPDIAVRKMTEALADALGRNGGILRLGSRGSGRQRRQAKQPLAAIAPSDGRHVVLRLLDLTTSLHV